jgi:hypothetical protein
MLDDAGKSSVVLDREVENEKSREASGPASGARSAAGHPAKMTVIGCELLAGSRISRSKGEIILVGKSVASIADCNPRPLLVPPKYGPEIVNGVKKMTVKSDDSSPGLMSIPSAAPFGCTPGTSSPSCLSVGFPVNQTPIRDSSSLSPADVLAEGSGSRMAGMEWSGVAPVTGWAGISGSNATFQTNAPTKRPLPCLESWPKLTTTLNWLKDWKAHGDENKLPPSFVKSSGSRALSVIC